MHGFGNMLKEYLKFYKISQTQFADSLNITQKHMNAILNENADLSEELIVAISLLTDIDPRLILLSENKKRMHNYLHTKFNNEKEIKEYLNSFYIKELQKKKWLKLKDENSCVQNAVDLLECLKVRNFDMLDIFLDKRIMYKKKDDANRVKIYLWIKRCDSLIKGKEIKEYSKDNFNQLLEELIIERNKKFNEENLIKLFNKYGIYLVIEDALKGTKVRGATLVKGTNPCIYMTRYYKEKASFYFALYHELSHVKTNYNMAKNKVIIASDEENEFEKKADVFAINNMINDLVWNKIILNLDKKEFIAHENNIPLCFLYSRLAYENIIKYSSKEYNQHKEMI